MAIHAAMTRNFSFCLWRPLPRKISQLSPISPISSRRLDTTIIIQRARRNMSTNQSIDSVPHEIRTASEPRQNALHSVRLSKVTQVNPTVRLLQLTLPRDQASEGAREVSKYPLYCPSLLFFSHLFWDEPFLSIFVCYSLSKPVKELY